MQARGRAPLQQPERCFPRDPAIWLRSLKDLLQKKLLNAQVNLNFRLRPVKKPAKNIADLCPGQVLKRPTAVTSQGNIVGILWPLPPYLP